MNVREPVALALFLIIIYLSPLASPRAEAASVYMWYDNAVMLEGEIVEGDCARLQMLLYYNDGVKYIGIYTPGGLIFEGTCIGSVVRAYGLDTVALEAHSAGAMIWMAGHKRIVVDGGRVRQHGASYNGGPVPDDLLGDLLVILFEYYITVGVPPATAEQLVADSSGSPDIWVSWDKYKTHIVKPDEESTNEEAE